MSTGPRAGDPSLETSRTHTSLWLLNTEQRALQKVTKIIKTRCCVHCRGEQEKSGMCHRGGNVTSLVLTARYFSSFLSPRHAQSSIKQQMPRDRTKDVDGGRGPALPLSRSGIPKDLAEALSTLGVSHINPVTYH